MRFTYGILLVLAFQFSWVHAQPQGKKILLEKITSAGCPSCPWGDNLIQGYLLNDTNIIPVGIHLNDPNHVDQMSTTVGDSILDDYYWATPTMMVDRYKWSAYSNTAMPNTVWTTMIDARKQMPMLATIGGTTTYNGQRDLTVSLSGTILWDLNWDLRVNAYLVEDEVTGTGLGYDQLNGYNNTTGHPLFGLGDPIVGYVHNWVLRDMLGGHLGTSIFPNPVAAGHFYSHTFQTTVDSAFDETKCSVILVVQRYDANPENREILNVVKLGLNGNVLAGVADAPSKPTLSIWPNPTDGRINVSVSKAGNWTATLMDLQGRTILEKHLTGNDAELDASPYPAGVYLLRLADIGEISITQKLILR
jgi:hypothetical protein